MNRAIKFRAWSIKYKEFISIGFSVLGETTCFNLIELWYIENKAVKSGLLDLVLHDVFIEQFTSLKDKYGNDIYEGDILSHSNSGIFEIRFIDYGFCLFHNGIKQETINTQHMEIIGNIHENPELL